MRTMMAWERKVRAHKAGLKGGAPRTIDYDKVKALRAERLKHREIAAEMGISMPSVARILAGSKKRCSDSRSRGNLTRFWASGG